MSGRYGARDIQTQSPRYQKSAKDVYVREARVDYSNASRGIINALQGIKEYRDQKADEDGKIRAMGLHGVVVPGSDDREAKTFEHMQGQAFVTTYRDALMAKSAERQDLPDDQYDAEIKKWTTEQFKGKSRDFVMGVVAGGGIEVDDAALAARRQAQRGKIAKTWISGTRKRAENAMFEKADVSTLISKLDYEMSDGLKYHANPQATRKAFYEAVRDQAMADGNYDLLDRLVRTSGSKENGRVRLIDTELHDQIMRDLKTVKAKQDAGMVNTAFLEINGMRTASGAPDRKRQEEYLNQRMRDDPSFTLEMRNRALATTKADYQTRLNEEKRVRNETNTDALKGALGKYREGDIAGALQDVSNNSDIAPQDAVKFMRIFKSDLEVHKADQKEQHTEMVDGFLMEIHRASKDNPLYTLTDALDELGNRDLKPEDLARLQRVIKLSTGPVRDQYNRIMKQIDIRFGYDQVKGFDIPNQKAALKTHQYIEKRIEKAMENNEEIDWDDMLTGIDKPGHWLNEMIKDNRPGLMESFNQSMASMGMSEMIQNPKTRRSSWTRALNKELGTIKEVPVTVSKLTAYVRSQEETRGLTDPEVRRLLSDPDNLKAIVEDYVKANN